MVLVQFLTTPTYTATAICPLKCLGHDVGSQGIPRVLSGSLATVLPKRSVRLRCPGRQVLPACTEPLSGCEMLPCRPVKSEEHAQT